MAYDHFKVLQPVVLTGLIREMFTPDTPYTTLFKGSTTPAEFDIAVWDEIVGSRDIQKHAHRGSPARPVNLMGVKKRTAVTARIFLKKTIDNSRLSFLREPGKFTRDKLERIVGDELTDLKSQIDRTIEKSCADALFTGIITISQPSDIAHEVIAKISFPTTGMSATDDWRSATTNFIGADNELAKARKAAQSLAGWNIGDAYGSDLLARLFYKSSFIQTFLSNRGKDKLFLDHRINRLDGVNWNYTVHGYKAGETSFSQYAPDSTLVFMPSNKSDILTFMTAPELVPSQTGVVPSFDSLSYVDGYFSYSKILDDPVSIVIYAGINYLPVIKRPSYVIRYDYTGG